MLRFHAEAVAELVHPAALPFYRAIQEVARVKLQSRLRGKDFQHASRAWLCYAGHQSELAYGLIEYPVVIVSFAKFELLIILIDARPYSGGCAEIKRCAIHRAQFACRDQRAVHRRKLICRHHDHMFENVSIPCEVEIGMLGEVNN